MTEISRKVKGRIMFSLSMFVMLFIVLSFVSVQQLQETENFRLSDETIEKIDLNIRDLFRADVDFYNFDLINAEFFSQGKTQTLTVHDSLLLETQSLIDQVRKDPKYEVTTTLADVENQLVQYDKSFKIITSKLQQKGFKDYGLEGKLRGFAHDLEDKKLIAVNEILMLRRHEKDYLLRDDRLYADQLNTLSSALIQNRKNSPETVQLITDYTSAFNDLVSVNEEIGMHKQSGIKGELNRQTLGLLTALGGLNWEGEVQTASNHSKAFNMFIVVAVFAIVFCGVLIFLTAKNL